MIASAELHETLLELAFLFGLCIAVAMLFLRLKMPPVVGYLASGALVGPNGFGLVPQVGLVEQLAEIGVIVLLFTVGLELSLAQLARMRASVFLGGGIQLAATISLGAATTAATGMPFGQAVFIGYMLALSSTAAITKLLSDRGELGRPAGRMAVAICIAQDLAVVPMILSLPLLSGDGSGPLAALGEMSTSLGLFAGLAALSWLVVPRLLDLVARTRSRELFLLAVLVSCLSISLATSVLGLSLALGAFLAGVVLGGSDHHHQAVAEVEPFRDALASLFFVSIGMLFDARAFLDEPLVVGLALLAVVAGKAGLATLAVRMTKAPWWTAGRAGLMVAQVGEFSFVIAQIGDDQGLLTERASRIFLVVAVLSIALTPLLFALGKRIGRTGAEVRRFGDEMTDHVVLVGYGPIGQGLVRSLQKLGIPFRVLELNAETVQKERLKGLPIIRGDAARRSVLEAVGLPRARMLVIATNDPQANQKVVQAARHLAPKIHILSRASYLAEVPSLEQAGADEIVPQELETGVEIVARTLRHFLLPDSEVEAHVQELRSAAYAIRKVAPRQGGTTARLSQYVPGLRVAAFRVEHGSRLAGRPLGESEVRRTTGLSIVSVRRGDETILNVGPDTALEAGDVIVGIGGEDAVQSASHLFRGPGDALPAPVGGA